MAKREYSFFSWKRSDVLFVGVVLLLLFAVSRTQLTVSQMKTRDAQRKADVELVARALQSYYEDYEYYPVATGSGQIYSCGEHGFNTCKWGNDSIMDVDNVTYLKQLPVDPLADSGRTYVYEVAPDRKKFKIYVALEYARDPAWKKELTTSCGNNVQCNWYVEN